MSTGVYAIAFVATWCLLVPVTLVLVSVARSANRRAAIVEATLAGFATAALVKASALLYAHPRPFVVHHVLPLVAHAADNAFPSDHAAAAGLAVAYLWTRSRPSAVIALTFALLIGAARVAAQLHWPIDIIAGYAFGITGGIVALNVSRRLFPSAAHHRAQLSQP
jgi:undecaprenyl-diphosphatase